jgi:hypothetical protein
MIYIYDFFYYSLFRAFKLVKRVGVKDEDLASSFYSILLATNTGMLLILSRLIIPKSFFENTLNEIFFKLLFAGILLAWHFICKHYFLKKENDIRIVAYFEGRYSDKNTLISIIGILYTVISFLGFIIIGDWVNS